MTDDEKYSNEVFLIKKLVYLASKKTKWTQSSNGAKGKNSGKRINYGAKNKNKILNPCGAGFSIIIFF